MHRLGKVDEIAQVALFLASDRAAYITAETLGVDGGRHTNSSTVVAGF
jgi:3-oxoacyl-[acyl-carrier protein] reductase